MPALNPALKNIKRISDLDIRDKTVFMRLDLNVPISGSGDDRKVDDDNRIQEALPTIRYAIEQGAKLILASHLGRPKGKPNPEYSLEPVAAHLAQLIEPEVTLTDDCVGEGIEMMIQGMKGGNVLMLENLRFHEGEEKNDPEFVHQLARLAEVYITDAFGTAHRKHASTYGLPSLTPDKGIGFLIEKELEFLGRLLHDPPKPFYTLLGGSKVSDKIKTIDSLMKRTDGIAIGGAMAHAFWAVEGKEIPAGAKQPAPEDVQAAKKVLSDARRKEIPILIPQDTNLGFDIGPKTVEQFLGFLKDGRSIFWNGPLGWFEKPEYAEGTFAVARGLAETGAMKVIGGGDTVSAIKQSGVADKFDHLSTGGGAVLEYLEKGGLPGIDILKSFPNQNKKNLELTE